VISLVIPCYNEGQALNSLIKKCEQLVERSDVEILLVDNGSTDQTSEILKETVKSNTRIRVVKVEVNIGYGHGILAGLAESRGEFVGWTHADLQTDPMDLIAAERKIESLADPDYLFVKGLRRGRPIADMVFTIGMSIFESALFRMALWDINAQPTILSRSLYERWTDPPSDFSLDLFAYVQARRIGATIIRFPVFFGDRLYGHSKWNLNWKAKLNFIRRTLSYSRDLKRNFSNE